MTKPHQINEFIEKYDIRNEFKNLFENLLNLNSLEDLNIQDKKIHIDSSNLNYLKTELNFHKFQTSILKNNAEIGSFAVLFDENFNIIDDFFLIFDTQENETEKINTENIVKLINKQKSNRKFVITPINILKKLGYPVSKHNFLLENKILISKIKKNLQKLNEDGILEKRHSLQDYKGIKEVGYNLISKT